MVNGIAFRSIMSPNRIFFRLFFFSQGAAQPSLQAGCINCVGRDRSGVATSTYFLGGDIGQGIGPMAGGFVLARIAGLAGYPAMPGNTV